MRSRVHFLSILLLVLFGFVIYQLANIQLISTESYGSENVNLLEESVSQRTHAINLTSGRGDILDRDNNSLTSRKEKDVVIFPFLKQINIPDDILYKMNVFDPTWREKMVSEEEAIYLSELAGKRLTNDLYEAIKKESIPGLVAVERTIEGDPSIATHLLGIVRNNSEEYRKRYSESTHLKTTQPIGISGLERTFDSFLLSENSEKLMYHVDAMGNPLLGLDIRYQGKEDYFYPIKIKTTIDSEFQALTESILDKHGIEKGGVVLLDIKTNELLAMASRPKINASEPFKNNTIENKMLTAHFPGSVFKTVVAAAAIETSKQHTTATYDCNRNLYGDKPTERQLGELTFEESFAQSCNYTFAEIAKALMGDNKEVLEEYAEKLGLIGPVGWEGNLFHFKNFKQLADEQVGRVWGNIHDPHVDRAIAQTAIGQKEVRVTPIAMANMIATIVNNGVRKEVKVVDQLLYNNDTTMYEFKTQDNLEDKIKTETAVQLKQLLVDVVESGTGWGLRSLPVAGKTGTAETGNEGKYHHWFAGYFPIDEPEFAMVVVDLDQTDELARTTEVYRDIVVKLLER